MPTDAATTANLGPRACWVDFFLWSKSKGLGISSVIVAAGDMLTHGGWQLMDKRVFHSTFPRVTESKNGLESFKNRDGFCIRFLLTRGQYDILVAETMADLGKKYPVSTLFFHLLNRWFGIKVKRFVKDDIFVCSGEIAHLLNVATGEPKDPELYGPTELLGYFAIKAGEPGDNVMIYDLKGNNGLVWSKNNTPKHILASIGRSALSRTGDHA